MMENWRWNFLVLYYMNTYCADMLLNPMPLDVLYTIITLLHVFGI